LNFGINLCEFDIRGMSVLHYVITCNSLRKKEHIDFISFSEDSANVALNMEGTMIHFSVYGKT